MFDFFKNVRWSLFLIGVLTIVIGVAMVMNPNIASDTIVKILGGIMGISAIISILGYFIDRARGITSFTNLLVGGFMLIMGAILYFRPATFVEFLGYIFAAVVLVQGINLMVEGIASKKYATSHWGQTVLMGIICVALAVLVFLNPFGSFDALMILTGVSLIIAGVLNLFVAGRIGVAAHNFNKAVKEVERGAEQAAEKVQESMDDMAKADTEAPSGGIPASMEDVEGFDGK